MVQLKNPVDPFGEVDIFPQPDGTTKVKVTILMRPSIEGARTALAIDGSNSMRESFAAHLPPLFRKPDSNIIRPVAQMMTVHLCNFAADGKTTVIYWACGSGGNHIEVIGELSEEEASRCAFAGPKQYGTGTKLLPPVQYFIENVFASAPWGMGILITDGVIEDIEEVKAYSIQLAESIAHGKTNPVKLVLIGVGNEIDEKQMEELDDLDLAEGIDVDIWDHKMAAHMRSLDEIFSEVVDEEAPIVPRGKIIASTGVVAKDFPDGMPGKFFFILPRGATGFTLSLPDQVEIQQDITEAIS